MDYTQLDVVTRLNTVRSRIKDLEGQYFQLSLRIDAPDLNSPPTEMDNQNLTILQTGLDKLHIIQQQLEQEVNPPAPAPTPAA